MIQIRLTTNFTINLIGMLLPFSVTLITVPIYISLIGVVRYGLLSIIWILLGYFGLLDFGLSRASENALARLPQASKERAGVLMTSLYVNLSFGILAGLVLYLIGNPLLRHVMVLTDALSREVEGSIPWVAVMVPLGLLSGIGTGAMESRERFFVINVLQGISAALDQIFPLVCVIIFGPSLTVAVPAVFAARALSVAITFAFVVRAERPSVFMFDRTRFKELLGFGAWLSVTNVISPLMTSIDRFLIGSLLGAAAVAHYTVAMNLTLRSQLFATALARTLFPRFSRLDRAQAFELARRSSVSLAYGYGAICGSAIIVGRPFLTLWVGPEFASYASPVFEVLLLGAWMNGMAFIPYSFLQGQMRPDLVAKLHAFELLPFILVLWLLLSNFGLMGAAFAWCGRVAFDAALLFKLARFRSEHLLRLAPALVLLFAAYAITQTAEIQPLYSVIVGGVIFLTFVGSAIAFDATSRRILWALPERIAQYSRRN